MNLLTSSKERVLMVIASVFIVFVEVFISFEFCHALTDIFS